MSIKRFWAFLLVVFFVLSVSSNSFGMKYSIVDLGVGYEVFALNDSNQIVGSFPSQNQGVLWQDGKLVSLDNQLGRLALDINNNGQVVGQNNARAYVWDINNGIQYLSSVNSAAMKINNNGEIVGWTNYSNNGYSTLWYHGQETIISDGGGNGVYDYGINDNGLITGSVRNYGPLETFVYQDGILQTLNVGEFNPRDININGDIVGIIYTNEDGHPLHAGLYQNGTLTDLGTLEGGFQSEAFAINDSGLIVGRLEGGDLGHKAFLWKNGSINLLNSMVLGENNWNIEAAFDINNNGQIIGIADFNSQQHAVLLNPLAEVTTTQTYLSDYLTLGDTFTFDYWWEMGIEPTEPNLDVLFFNGTEWETFGWALNFDGASDQWNTASFYVPEWVRGENTRIMFSLLDLGQETNPTVYLRNVGSAAAPVPEPSTIVLMGLGLVGLVGIGRKKNKGIKIFSNNFS